MESKKWLDMSWWDGRGLCLLVASSSAPLPATPTHLLIPLCTFPHAMHRRLFPSPDLYNVSSSVSHSVVSDSLRPHGLWPARLLCLWNSPGRNAGVGCHALLQGIFPNQGSIPSFLPPVLAGTLFTSSATWEAAPFYHVSPSSLHPYPLTLNVSSMK